MPKIGLIAEGETDQAVIENILIGLGIESADILPLRPKYRADQTDKGYQGGTWQGVKNDCLERVELDKFLQIADNDWIIIQIDTAECEETNFGVLRPAKLDNPHYASELRQNVINKVNEWVDNNYENQLLYAVTIEEMESWILTIYLNEDTVQRINPKPKLENELRRKNITNKGCKDKKAFFDKQTVDFKKKKTLNLCISRNKSLQEFTESVKDKLNLR